MDVTLPFAAGVPLFVAALLLLLREPAWLRRGLTLGVAAGALVYAGFLIAATYDGSVLVHSVGLWPGGVAIPFVADTLSALMLAVTSLLTLVCSAFGMVAGDDEKHFFQPLVMVLFAGVAGALLTGDLFNFFVFVEVMLLPSYVLIGILGGVGRVRAARVYITYNLLASVVLLAGIAFLYGVVGRVNFAALSGAASESTAAAVAGAVVLVALGMKSAVVPVHGWLSRVYPETSPAVSALFSGLHTKVGIYAIYRIYSLLFDGDDRWLGIGVLIMCATMVVGVLGAVGEGTMRSILAFHMVSQIGYILLGVALFGPLGLAAGIFYLLHHMIVKASLFLSTGAVETVYGSQRLEEVGGVARKEPLVAFAFIGAALSLTGIPPFSGFFAKFLLLQASIDETEYLAAVVVVAVSLFTLLSMAKIWTNVFWGPPGRQPPVRAPARVGAVDESGGGDAGEPTSGGGTEEDKASAHGSRRHSKAGRPLTNIRFALAAPALVLTLVSLGLGIGAQGLLDLSQRAAEGLLDTSTYEEAVIEP
ncbi:monovalent cation/H+ antiporter subunit D family protein [Spiractinospora alimapuensis]|uniref:monovalent cation/H+ antiporter subunit D family protein n=1 Tax=Spiractinospora alimapuensis TaxID=2820884 RepID=UPI001F2B3479|nr:monovalent cation/H+ antiporter subunit D family protein [Spiractinospora alimapuensis]QVQ50686.1 monovalent cation/H+ antiporter subunit D family protein [Spiractinospora alimapuensis]